MTSGTGRVTAALLTMEDMARFDTTVGAGVFGNLITVVVGVPVVVGVVGGQQITAVPGWLWVSLYVGLVAAQVACSWLSWVVTRGWVTAMFALMVVLGPAVVLGAPRAGWLPIVLVLTSALSAYLVPPRIVAMVVLLNTVVIAVAAAQFGGAVSEVAFSALIYGVLQVGTALSVHATQKEERTRRELAIAHAELRATTAALAETTRSAERLRIARDLHDAVGHQLTSLALELEVASHRPSEASVRIAKARDMAGMLLTDVRSVVSELREHSPDLEDSLAGIVADIPEPTVHLRVDKTRRLDEDRVLLLIRCVQEIVTNSIKHAQAHHLWIDVVHDESHVTLTAHDDGVAREPIALGNGLRGIAERAGEAGGTARFWVDKGFRVDVTVPAS